MKQLFVLFFALCFLLMACKKNTDSVRIIDNMFS